MEKDTMAQTKLQRQNNKFREQRKKSELEQNPQLLPSNSPLTRMEKERLGVVTQYILMFIVCTSILVKLFE